MIAVDEQAHLFIIDRVDYEFQCNGNEMLHIRRRFMDPILIDFPQSFESDRLIIRVPRVGDGAAVNAGIVESMAELKPWMPWAQAAPSVEDTEANTRRAIAKTILREDIRLHFHLKDGTFVGGSGLHRINWDVPRFEIGYWVRASLCGKGYCTEGVGAIAGMAFEILHAKRVEIRCDDQNIASRRVAERAGFELEGILRNDSIDLASQVRSTAVYSRIAT
jgi:RimJ/RimL family protein N-acetyltransferase